MTNSSAYECTPSKNTGHGTVETGIDDSYAFEADAPRPEDTIVPRALMKSLVAQQMEVRETPTDPIHPPSLGQDVTYS